MRGPEMDVTDAKANCAEVCLEDFVKGPHKPYILGDKKQFRPLLSRFCAQQSIFGLVKREIETPKPRTRRPGYVDVNQIQEAASIPPLL